MIPSQEWKWNGEDHTWEINAPECYLWLVERPSYCDRGRWLAHIEPTGELARAIDSQDGWPRYYFDLDRAKAECEAWLIARKQLETACPECWKRSPSVTRRGVLHTHLRLPEQRPCAGVGRDPIIVLAEKRNP